MEQYIKNKKSLEQEWNNAREYLKKIKNMEEITENEIKWCLCKKNRIKYSNEKLFGLYRNETYHMALLMLKDGKIDQSILLLCEVCYFDMNDVMNSGQFSEEQIFSNSVKMGKVGMLAPGIINEIYKLWKKHYISIEEIKEIFFQINPISLPFPISKAIAWETLCAELTRLT